MAQGDVQRVGRKRTPPESVKVRERVEKFCDHAPECPEGVQLLNPGFFMLERMRSQSVAKAKAAHKAKVRGK